MDKILRWMSDPANRPSWTSSTLAQMALISLLVFLMASGYVAVKVAHGMAPELAKEILSPFTWAATAFAASYLTARKMNGGPPSPPQNQTQPAGGTG